MSKACALLFGLAVVASACFDDVVVTPAGGTGAPAGPNATGAVAVPTAGATRAPGILSGTVTVEAGDHFFSPQELTVAVGTTVIWRIVGQSAHDVTAFDSSFVSSGLYFGSTFTNIFNNVGRYPYMCSLHIGDGMTGEVVVVPR